MAEKLQEIGVVSYIKGGYAYLKTDTASACGSCSSKKSCGSGRLNLTGTDYSIRVPNNLNLQQGDQVILGMSSDKLLFGTLLVYLLPLFLLFLFAGVIQTFSSEVHTIFGGLSGLLIGLLIAKRIISIKSVAQQFEPEVREKI